MYLRRVLLFMVGAVLLSATVYAQDTSLQLDKKNAFAIKFGYKWYEDSNVFNFWGLNNNDFDALVTSLAYERMLRPRIGLEVAWGFSKSSEVYPSGSDLTITNWFISPTLKYYFPVGDSFLFYGGAGVDYYNTEWDHIVNRPTFTYEYGHDRFNSLGLHGLGGVEWYFFKTPEKHGFYSAPVSLFFECQYTWLEIDEVDDREIREINAQLGQSYPKHDLDLGGIMFFLGLRWHY
jgi:opacity protein-like surface antigen